MNCQHRVTICTTGFRLVLAGLCLALCVSLTLPEAVASPRQWAEKIENPHLENFHKVSDSLYRSAQPSADGFKELQRMGIRTIINLRKLHSDEEALKDTNLRYEEIEMTAAFPLDEQTAKFLRIVSKKENGPFLVHCQYGSDRTGTMAALYRMIIQGWSKDDAIAEMKQGGFGFHSIWNWTLVPYLRDVNPDLLKEKAGLK